MNSVYSMPFRLAFRYTTMAVLIISSLLCTLNAEAQHATISGYIKDAQTGEVLLGAVCFDTLTYTGTSTNTYGYYSLQLPAGKSIVKVSYVGYQPEIKTLDIKRDTLVNLFLQQATVKIQEVEISAEKAIRQQTLMGKQAMNAKQIETLPAFVGEADILRAASVLPGISMGKEGYADIFVRGGDRGQNLILLDGIKLYNTSHVGGFVSLFNPNMINSMDIYKGGFPSRYGGRASGILDVTTINGNTQKLHGKLTVGLLSTGLMLEGPLTKKITFAINARTSFYDLFTIRNGRTYKNGNEEVSFMKYTFFDINGKITWETTERSKTWLSLYNGRDINKHIDYHPALYNMQTHIDINNMGISAGNTTIVAPGLFLRSILSFSLYNNRLDIDNFSKDNSYDDEGKTNETYSSQTELKDITAQSRIEYTAPHGIKYVLGYEGCRYGSIEGMQSAYQTDEYTQTDTIFGTANPLVSIENSLFAEAEKKLFNRLSINAGIRATHYHASDTSLIAWEPRLSACLLLSPNISLKANYTIMNQFNHVLINRYAIFEKDIWIPANKQLLPQKAEQVSGGIFMSMFQQRLDISCEAYYKRMNHLLEYRPPLSLEDYGIKNINDFICNNGTGETYGYEWGVQSKSKYVQGGASYTLAWNERQFEQINNGKPFPFVFEKRHDMTLWGSYNTGKRYSFNANFTLASGIPFTMAQAFVKEDTYAYAYYAYGGLNNSRFPLYHRLDISIVKSEKTKQGFDKQFKINLYNVYAKQNPVKIYFDNYTGKLYQISLYSIIPSFSYSLSF